MSESNNPFIRGYRNLRIIRTLLITYEDDEPPVWRMLHASQAHLPDDQVAQFPCVVGKDFALITEGQEVPPDLEALCTADGIVRSVVYVIEGEDFDGQRMLVGDTYSEEAAREAIQRLSFATGVYSRCWEISSAHITQETRGATPSRHAPRESFFSSPRPARLPPRGRAGPFSKEQFPCSQASSRPPRTSSNSSAPASTPCARTMPSGRPWCSSATRARCTCATSPSTTLWTPISTVTRWWCSMVAPSAAIPGSTCSSHASARTVSCTTPDPSSPSTTEGLFLARSTVKRVRPGAVSCKSTARCAAILPCMFVGVAGTCPRSRDLRGCECGPPHWSVFFHGRAASTHATHKGPFPCGPGVSCSSSRRFPWTVPSPNP